MDKIAPHLLRYYRIHSTHPLMKNLTDQLRLQFDRGYTTSISTRDVFRAQNDFRIVEAIQDKLARNKLLLRVTDKSNILYIARFVDFDQKAQAYREKTKAYQELTANPLEEILRKVTRLLNDLRAKGLIQANQYEKMMPKRDKVRLAYMYFNPKVHKVCISSLSFPSIHCSFLCFCLTIIARCTITTHHFFYSSANYTYFKILRRITSTII